MSVTNQGIPRGNPVKITVVFSDPTGFTFDPDRDIAMDVTFPDREEQTFKYPGDLVRESPGTYSMVVAATEDGSIEAQGRGVLASGLPVTSTRQYQKITPN